MQPSVLLSVWNKPTGFQPRPMKETAADSIAWFRQNGRL
jgi:hypothetical protein